MNNNEIITLFLGNNLSLTTLLLGNILYFTAFLLGNVWLRPKNQLGPAASGLAFISFTHGKCPYSRLPNCKFGRTDKKRRPSRHGRAILDESDEFYGFWVLVDDLHETDGGTFHASSIRIYSYIYISEKKIIRISFTISVQIDRCRPIHSKYIGLFVFPTI